ncbi:MAG: ABC transporter permease, partial [Synergistaceae bacterium]|nr:ABC transporter permease [Synergistaceae bacterium]
MISHRSQLGMIWHQLAKNRLAIVGLVIIAAMIAASVGVSLFADRSAIVRHNLRNKLQGVSAAHPFGTDAFGRDQLLRIIYGTRISLSIGFLSVLGAMLIGGGIGAFSSFYGGRVDILVMRLMDMLMAIPSTLFAICIVSALGNGFGNLLLAIMISLIPQFALIVRSSVLTIKESEFIEAARASGTG